MASPSSGHFIKQKLSKFPRLFLQTVLEWILIVVLFIEGLLAFIGSEFARIFEMPIPCLLCTRIDHVLVHRNADFYCNDSICVSHKKEVSFLAYCHNHSKLSDIRKMCEQCLLSFATEKASDCDTYKSLVGILHKNLECFVEDEDDDDDRLNLRLQLRRKEDVILVERTTSERCSCCGEFLKIKSSFVKRRANNGGSRSVHSQAPTTTPRAFGVPKNEDSRGLESPRVRYSELKFPGNEGEILEDEVGFNASTSAVKEDAKAASVPLLPDSEYMINEACKSPIVHRGNRFFGIPPLDSATSSPRWSSRFQRKSPLEKSELASDAVDGNPLNEVEADSILHRLKRQVKLDRKSLIAMYMELDEERSASTVAANNAMAMITWLQAEKAAVQMEALQYQRMMEEQAEYDQEALQVLRDLLSKREDEVNDLVDEVSTCREKYGCEGKEVDVEGCGSRSGNDYQELNPES